MKPVRSPMDQHTGREILFSACSFHSRDSNVYPLSYMSKVLPQLLHCCPKGYGMISTLHSLQPCLKQQYPLVLL